MRRRSWMTVWLALAALVALGLAVPSLLGRSGAPAQERPGAESAAARYPVSIHVPEDVGRLDTSIKDIHGRRNGATCGTCHVEHKEPPFAEKAEDLKTFHRAMPFKHGNLTCSSCHAQEDRTLLHLADGRRIEFQEVVDLCTQCHGPQARDYRRGSHGGMNGYWDLSRGPRVRNSCIDCHTPHSPAWSQVQPVFRPRDRFLTPPHGAEGGSSATHPREEKTHE